MARLLLVEDDDSFRESLAETLRQDNFDVVAADNGRDALNAFVSQQFDLVLSAVNGTKLDGIGLLRAIFKHGGFVPCIVLASAVTPDLERRAALVGGLVCFSKPIDLSELYVKIRAFIDFKNRALDIPAITVASLAQALARDRRTCRVIARSGECIGVLCFVDGDLVGASLGDDDGLEVAQEILTWGCADVNIAFGCPQIVRTIRLNVDSILLSAMHFADEEGPVDGQSAARCPTALNYYQLVKEKTVALEVFLEEFKGINGYLASGIMDATGEVLVSHSVDANVDLAAFGAVFNDIFRAGHEASRKIGLESCRLMTLNTPKGIVVMECTGVDAAAHLHLIVVLREDGNHALTKMTLGKMCPKVVAAMS
ncbi:MAG: hypothetical protein BWK76_03580 [Desulfobulbaceae bacterium A2]|nr:MAG: hypothetical protein BWK76_03580 [Desulfobulbaceae bacterium A2]